MKKSKFLKSLFSVILSGIILVLFCSSAWAESLKSYIFDSNDNAVYSPLIYNMEKVISGADLPSGDFSDSSDLFVDENDNIYVLDQGNHRIVILDADFQFVKELSKFHYQGKKLTLNDSAKGIFYQSAQKSLYVSDTGNDRILVMDLDGNVKRIVYKPKSDLLDESLPFRPTKLIVDNLGIIFTLSENVNTGAMIIFEDDGFGGFFGVNAIKETDEVLKEFFLRKLFSYSDNNASESYQATEFNNVFWSSADRCIYTVSPSAGTVSTEVSKLNAVGNNLLSATSFGDANLVEGGSVDETDKKQNLVDIVVDKDNLFSVLDSTTGKIYQYDQNCNLLGVFGGLGYTKDSFLSPIAMECNSKKQILVLDNQKNRISVFNQTAYGQELQSALELYNDGQYVECLDLWNNVLRENANLLSAHIGIGKAYEQLGQYSKAMEYFKIGNDKENYALAKSKSISKWLEDHFAFIVILVVIVFLFIYAYDSIKKGFGYILKCWRGRRRHET